MTTYPILTFENWVPQIVIVSARGLHAGLAEEGQPVEAFELLARLATDGRMRFVWKELYKPKRGTAGAFEYPARVTNVSHAAALRQQASKFRPKRNQESERWAEVFEAEAAMLEKQPEITIDPPWNEQDLGVRRLFVHSFRSALDISPLFLTNIKAEITKLDEVSKSLRSLAVVLQSVRLTGDAKKLINVAEDCEDEAQARRPLRP